MPACLDAVRGGLQLAERSGVHLLDPYFFMYGVSMAATAGNRAAAEELLQRMAARPLVNPMAKSFYHILRSRVEWTGGNNAGAVNDAKIALELVGDLDSRVGPFFCRAMMALACHSDGQREEAQLHLTKMRKVAEGANYLTYITDLIGAGFALDLGNESECDAMLQRAMDIGARQGFLNFPWWQQDVMARLCARALEREIQPAYVRNIIRKRHLLPEEPPLHIETWPWQVKITTLGSFSLTKDEQPVTLFGKVQRKPLELLKALIAFGGADVGMEQIADALWPDAEGDKARNALEITIHRLRRFLSSDAVVQIKDGRLSLDPRRCWVDAWAFERMIENADVPVSDRAHPLAPRSTATGKKSVRLNPLSDAERAIELYHGHFLPADAREPWTTSMRERLRSKFLRVVAQHGTRLMESNRYAKALDLFQKGLEIDELAEEFYQHLMLCHRRLGRQAEAVLVYQRCRAALAGSLGIEPSPKTEEIYRSLLPRR
jgi:LuxR family maltose regulon positive regulatory protein